MPAVRSAFVSFTENLEGHVSYMYLDNLGLVTTGDGNLIDPVSIALTLPWTVSDSTVPATRLQIVAEWNRVKALVAHKNDGGGRGSIFEKTARLHLSEDGIAILVDQKLDLNEHYLSKSFPTFADWPADAQLALHSMAWALGAAFRPKFPRFSAAVDAYDFAAAAGPAGNPIADPSVRGESWMKDDTNPGLRRRNLANRVLFTNAFVVRRDAKDPDTLVWPASLT